MPEFRYLIRCRASYFTISPVPFSSEYVEGFLRRLRFGWYVKRDNWAHRQPIYVDEWTLNVHVRHYYLDGIEGNFKPQPGVQFLGGSVERMRAHVDNYLNHGCLYLMKDDPTPPLLTYYLKNYGFVVVGPDPPSLSRN